MAIVFKPALQLKPRLDFSHGARQTAFFWSLLESLDSRRSFEPLQTSYSSIDFAKSRKQQHDYYFYSNLAQRFSFSFCLRMPLLRHPRRCPLDVTL